MLSRFFVASATAAFALVLMAACANAQLANERPAPQPSVQLYPQLPVNPPNPPPIVLPPPPAIPAASGPMPANIFVWNPELAEHTTKVGVPALDFSFFFTNVSSGEVTINLVQPSCGCTTVRLPAMPWKIPAGGSGEIPVHLTLNQVPGTIFKNLTVYTDKGNRMLMVKTVIEAAPAVAMTEEERKRNQELVKADRQAVFKGDCAKCHVQPTIGKLGKELYDTACGICHEAEHRATMVADLRAPKVDTNAEYYKNLISHGRPGTLMPAFSQLEGGPLSDVQIATLVDYLVKTMPTKAVVTNAVPHQAAK